MDKWAAKLRGWYGAYAGSLWRSLQFNVETLGEADSQLGYCIHKEAAVKMQAHDRGTCSESAALGDAYSCKELNPQRGGLVPRSDPHRCFYGAGTDFRTDNPRQPASSPPPFHS